MFWTGFAYFAPSGAHGTAANHFRLRLRHSVGAFIVGVTHVAKFLAHINAFTAGGKKDVSFGTDAVVTSVRVDACPDATNQRILKALVDIDAHCVGVVNLVAVVAGAHETAKSIGTSSVLAEVIHFATLVNVLEDDGDHIGSETRSSRAKRFEFVRFRSGTKFTGGSPSSAH